jgi:hypothetical protein
MCSFWYVEALARAGDVDQARFIFEKVLGYATTTSASIPRSSARAGSTSATSHRHSATALISTAYCLDREMDAAGRPR